MRHEAQRRLELDAKQSLRGSGAATAADLCIIESGNVCIYEYDIEGRWVYQRSLQRLRVNADFEMR
jgi:sulfur relay (sulfurtransferase) DsrF/TusC family protein